MEHSFNQFLKILSGRARPLMPALSRRSIDGFFAYQAKSICDDWTNAAREGRRLWARRAP